jgi:hypothetical protein
MDIVAGAAAIIIVVAMVASDMDSPPIPTTTIAA